jgi:hypothetical protein
MAICYEYFMVNWYILEIFGIFYGQLVYIGKHFQFWYVALRKIWQPCCIGTAQLIFIICLVQRQVLAPPVLGRVARWFLLNQKSQFLRALDWKMLIYLMAIWNI